MPHPKNSALYWTGSGMSVNRVMNGTTKKQQNTQGQERVNCLKIDKRRNWVRYLTDRKDITMTDTYNSESLIRIKTENMDIINGKIHQDVEASITSMVINLEEPISSGYPAPTGLIRSSVCESVRAKRGIE